MARILRIFAFVLSVFFVGDAFAAGYTCSDKRIYSSCEPGYYLAIKDTYGNTKYNSVPQAGNFCEICPKGYYCAGGTSDKQKCQAGYYGNKTGLTAPTCSGQCKENYFCPEGSTSATQNRCPADYPNSLTGAGKREECYSNTKERPSTGEQLPCSQPANSHDFQCESCTPPTCSYTVYSNSSGTGDGAHRSGCKTNTQTCQQTVKSGSVVCKMNYYLSTDQKSCEKCPDSHPNSADNAQNKEACFTDCTKACSGNNTSACPANATCTYNSGATVNGQEYYGQQCNVSDFLCPVSTVSCGVGYYYDNNSGTCSPCPPGYPHSAAGSIYITSCYSDSKSRAWTGSQTACSKPSNSLDYSCNTCSNSACTYVAYSNSAGTGDGTIKSGCSSNSASCQQTVKPESVSCAANYYLNNDKISCSGCPPTYPNSDAGTTSDGYCYTSCADKTGYTKSGRDYKSATDTCTYSACTYTVTYNANGGSGTTASSTHTYDSAKTLTSNGFTRDGYVFLGWSTASGATSATYQNGQSVTNLTATCGGTVPLYAVWAQCTCTNATSATGCSAKVSNNVCNITWSCNSGYYKATRSASNNGGGYTATCDPCTTNAGSAYTASDGNRNTVNTCYRSCSTSDVSNSGAVTGKFYYGATAPSSCTATSCKNNTWLDDSGKCNSCSASYPNHDNDSNGEGYCYTSCADKTGYTKSGRDYKSATDTCTYSACTYTVTYNANGGSGTTASSTHTYDSAKTLTSNGFTRDGYVFLGWSTTSGATSATYQNGQSVKNLTATCGGTVQLYAVWAQCTCTNATSATGCSAKVSNNVCNITWSCNSGYYKATRSATNNGGGYTAACDPCTTNAGSAYTASDGNRNTVNTCYRSCSTSDVSNSGAVTGKFYYGATAPSSCTATSCKNNTWLGSGKCTNCDPSYPNHDNDSNGEGYCYTSCADKTGYTKSGRDYKSATDTCTYSACTYTVTYNANGGSGTTASSTHTYDSAKTLTSNGFTRDGYVFLGWSTASGATSATYQNGQSVTNLTATCGGTVPLYAVWAKCSYTAGANSTIGSASTDTANNRCQYTVTCNTGYSKSGNTDTTPSFTAYGTAGSASGTLAGCSARTYNVTYSCGDGSGTAPSATTAKYDSSFTPAANTCSREGYKFDGWTVSGVGDKKAAGTAFTWKYAENKTLTAAWVSESEKTITYNKNNGEIVGDYKSACNVETPTFNLPTNVIRAGYTFDGWFNNAGLSGNKITSVAKGTCTTALTFWAKWTPCNSTTDGGCNCGSGKYPLNGTCTSCTTSCTSITGYTNGTYNICSGNTNTCYRDCVKSDVSGATAVTGTLTKGGTSTCKATSCQSGYYLDNGACKPASELGSGYTCPGGTNGKDKCSKSCTVSCNPQTCPSDAVSCTNGTETATGTQYYGGACDAKAPTCSLTIDKCKTELLLKNNTCTTCPDHATCDGTTGWTCNTNYNKTDTGCALGVFQCESGKDASGANCQSGYYCPGNKVNKGEENDTTKGCMIKCPAATGKTISSVNGANSISQCMATGTVDIEAANGTQNTGSGNKTCNWNAAASSYNLSCNIVPTSCIAGYYRDGTSDKCDPVGFGYYRAANDGVGARRACSALSNSNTVGEVKTETATSALASDCYNTCPEQNIVNGTLVPTSDKVYYDGTRIQECKYSANCDPGYVADGLSCKPGVYKITLNHNGATSGVNEIYLKYNTGWYKDAGTSQVLTSVSPLTLSGKTFGGYLSNKNDVVIDATGKLTTNYKLFTGPETIKASWTDKPQITCDKGEYYKGTGASCTPCPSGSYCVGITTVQDTNTESGRSTCESLNGKYVAATDASGKTMNVVVSSPEKSTSSQDCYATNLAYAPDSYTTGSQTCKYNVNTGEYTKDCSNQSIITCAGGYYRKNTTDVLCSVVGYGKYSPANSLTASDCPLNTDTNTRGTTNYETSESAEQCIMKGLSHYTTYGFQRRQCYYSNDSKKYDVNCTQATVVACNAGYWLDTTKSTDDCVPVGDGFYSPSQANCDGEEEEPTQPGCSVYRTPCPGGALTGKDNAASVSECNNVCPANSYCKNGVEYSCDTETGGSFPYSEAGSDEITDCYKKCTELCVEPSGCPTYFSKCKYDTSELIAGIEYYNSNTCTVKDAACKIDANSTTNMCDARHYITTEKPDCLSSCSDLEPAGMYSLASMPTISNGPNACYSRCSPTCNFANDYVLDMDGNVIPGTSVNHCPEHATCTEGTLPTMGYRWYPQTICTPTSFCSFTFVCDPGYVANTTDKVEYSYKRTLYSAPMSASDVATCTPGTYEITLDDNAGSGGNGVVYQKYTVGWYTNATATTVLNKLNKPTRQGYSFLGYYDAQSGGNRIIDANMNIPANNTFTTDDVLYAHWEKNVYNITYTMNDGNNNPSNPTTYTIEDTPVALLTPTKTGYVFEKWTGDKVVNNAIASGSTGDTTVIANWKATTFTVHFNPTDATGLNVPDVVCTYDKECQAPDALQMEHKTFNAWNTKADGLGQTILPNGSIKNLLSDGGEITLYAIWDQNMVDCESGYYFNNGVKTRCELGKYCPGTGKINEGSTGCIATCPAGGATIVAQATSIYECRKTAIAADIEFKYGTAKWDCAYTSGDDSNAVYREDCNAIALSCDAGYYYTDKGAIACTPVKDGYYSPGPVSSGDVEDANSKKAHLCPGETGATDDGIGSDLPRANINNCYSACSLTTSGVEHSKTVTANEQKAFSNANGQYAACSYTVTCVSGYTPQNGTNPKCVANKYKVTLNKNQGTGNINDYVECTFDSGACMLPKTDALTRDGYVTANKWCENPDGTGKCYSAGVATSANISDTGSDITLYATWNPGVFEIKLVAADAAVNATQNPVYLKYTVGWFADKSAQTPITQINNGTLPSKPGWNFAGYGVDDVVIIDATGALQTDAKALAVATSDTNANVMWSEGDTICDPGYYYNGNKDGVCSVCELDHWCPGGTFPTNTGVTSGHNACPDGGKSSGGVDATNIGVCYKQGLKYVSTTGKASGTQTCNYGTSAYDKLCREQSVDACVAGYWYSSGIDCSEVGINYYSADTDKKRYACPENGITGTVKTASEVGECYKTVDYTAVYGKGTQVCNYTAKNDDGSARYATNCREWHITSCQGGYYRAANDATDCDAVGYDAYSEEGSLDKTPCPDGGDTDVETAAVSTMCYKANNPFVADHGSGVRYCRYTPETQDYTVCAARVFHECDAGYYWNQAESDATDCVKVGYGFFGPVANPENEGYITGRGTCASFDGRQGKTQTEFSADASACFMENMPCNVTNGSGLKTCSYDISAQEYVAGCSACQVNRCDTKYYLNTNSCKICPSGSICGEQTRVGKNGVANAKPQLCKDLFDGRYPNSDEGSVDNGQCFGDCDILTNATSMFGRDYQGTNMTDTCKIKTCKATFYLDGEKSQCTLCPENSVCGTESGVDMNEDGVPDAKPQTCDALSGGTHTLSPAGSIKIEQCYALCKDYQIVGGTAIPKMDSVQYDDMCTYKGISETLNPCEIRMINGVETCVETSCKYDYELINGRCQKCERDNALEYKANGNCLVATCKPTYHPDGDKCESNVKSCVAPNAVAATQTWDVTNGAFGICKISECTDGYHVESNSCVPNVSVCNIEHGIGKRTWDTDLKKWNECIATSCDAGYTNNPYDSNEPDKQCGRCRNAKSVLGDEAVSSYSSGCKIATCLYQGELYNLDKTNNECVPICPMELYEDETGSMKWNKNTKKCERTCKDGFMPW